MAALQQQEQRGVTEIEKALGREGPPVLVTVCTYKGINPQHSVVLLTQGSVHRKGVRIFYDVSQITIRSVSNNKNYY